MSQTPPENPRNTVSENKLLAGVQRAACNKVEGTVVGITLCASDGSRTTQAVLR